MNVPAVMFSLSQIERALIENGSEGSALYDWWEINLVKNVSAEKRDYVNQIPEEVIRRILLTTVPPGELVFDPFCGSGTTPAVARRLGYNYLATDVSTEAVEIAMQRLESELL
jgi:DNA modification methylase